MQQIYFSHSYRDRRLNSYFLERFVRRDFELLADQKSQTWCVPKLERYMLESCGFISVIPRRGSDSKPTYSEYIGHELSLARRSAVPRLVFVDQAIRNILGSDFPDDVVTFDREDPARDQKLHDIAIRNFKNALLPTPSFPPLAQRHRKIATVIFADGVEFQRSSDAVRTILSSAKYDVSTIGRKKARLAFDDIGIIEQLRQSDICIFILGERLSYASVILGMAYAHCIPCLCLRRDPKATDTDPAVNGLIRWRDTDHLVIAFDEQFESFRAGMMEPVELAKASSPESAVQRVSTSRRSAVEEPGWNPYDGPSLIKHLNLEHGLVRDHVARVGNKLGTSLGADRSREKSMEICRELYDGVCKERDFVYELEPQSMKRGEQKIRSAPALAGRRNAATCIDLACLFASLLEQAYQRSVVIVIERPQLAHALVGYRCPWAPDFSDDLGSIRSAVDIGDLVLFEATGVAHSDEAVGAESVDDRRLGGGRLDFSTAKRAAQCFVTYANAKLRFLVDIHALRINPGSPPI
jgi:hypothetical protein